MDKFYLATVIDANGEQVVTALYNNQEKAINCLLADYEEEYTNVRSMGEKINNEMEELKDNLVEYGEYYVEEFGSTYYVKEIGLRD